MKGPFSIWSFFGITIWIDVITHAIFPKNLKRVQPYYNKVKEVSVIVPVHREPMHEIEATITSLYSERYPIKNVILCSDAESYLAKEVVKKLSTIYNNLYFCESPSKSKAKKINYAVATLDSLLGDFIYIRDCQARGEIDCIEKMVSYFTNDKVAAVTSYGRINIPKNFLSRAYHYGKAWINEIGRFRKAAQEKRQAVFVICGASTMFRKNILKNIPIPYGSKTEDTHYTWILQEKGYIIRIADDAMISSPEVDGYGMLGIKGQLKQAYRWSSGNIQCLYLENRDLFKNKSLWYTTILPGFIEAIMYSIFLLLLPFLFFFIPNYSLGFLIGDTVFSLLGTAIILPNKFFKTLFHYPQIFFFKYLNAAVFIFALTTVTIQAFIGETNKWNNTWIPPKTQLGI